MPIVGIPRAATRRRCAACWPGGHTRPNKTQQQNAPAGVVDLSVLPQPKTTYKEGRARHPLQSPQPQKATRTSQSARACPISKRPSGAALGFQGSGCVLWREWGRWRCQLGLSDRAWGFRVEHDPPAASVRHAPSCRGAGRSAAAGSSAVAACRPGVLRGCSDYPECRVVTGRKVKDAHFHTPHPPSPRPSHSTTLLLRARGT